MFSFDSFVKSEETPTRALESGFPLSLWKVRSTGEFGSVFASMSRRDFAVVLEWLKRGTVDPSAFGDVLIRWAAKEGRVEVVKWLLDDGRAYPEAVDIERE